MSGCVSSRDIQPNLMYLRDFQGMLNELEEELRDVEESEEIILGALRAAKRFYQASRVYVLELDTDLHVGVNTYEYSNEGGDYGSEYRQRIPLELIPRLEVALKHNQPLILGDIETIKESYPLEHKKLKQQGIVSLLATPFRKRINTGFIVVDNPICYGEEPGFLLLLSYVIVLELNELKQQRKLNMAEKRSSHQPAKDVYINMLGRLEVISAKGIISADDISSEQACNLLAYMVLNRRMRYSTRMLCEALWPEMDSDDPYNAVKTVVYRLRSVLACIGLKDMILASHGSFILNAEYNIITDVDRFDEICRRLVATSKQESIKRLYQGMVSLYRGGLLSGYDSFQWILPKAVYYQNKYLQMVKCYIDVLKQQKDYLEIQRVASEALAIDMQNEEMHFCMIMAILDQGNRNVARIHFRQARKFLDDKEIKVIEQRIGDKNG